MIIKIGNKKYVGQCNALSYIFHNRLFKKNIIEELIDLRKHFIKIDEKEVDKVSVENIYNILIRVIYTFMYTHDINIYSFKEFEKEIEEEIIQNETINEIIEILISGFTDEKVTAELEKISSDNTEKSIFPEHDFLISCLQLKLTINDLKILTYIDVIKMFVLTLNTTKENNNSTRKATQADIDRLYM